MSVHSILYYLFLNCFIVYLVSGRIHNLKLQNDNRHRMTLSTFGFLQGGTLAVNITLFSFKATPAEAINDKIFGFTLDKSNSPGLSNYVESMADCIWNKAQDSLVSVFFQFDLRNKQINLVRRGKALQHLKIVSVPREQYLFDYNLEHGVNLAGLSKVGTTPKPTQLTEKKEGKESAGDGKTATSSAPSRKARAADDDDKNPGGGAKAQKDTPKPESKKTATNKDTTTTATTVKVDKPKKDPKASNTTSDKDKTKTKPESSDKKVTTATDVKKSTTTSAPAEPDLPIEITDSQSKDLLTHLPMTETFKDSMFVYHSYFLVHVRKPDEEGLYNLFFHNCLHIDSFINLTVKIIEDNNGNYLSADEMPIPVLYFVFHVVFFILTCVWFSVLRRAEEGVYKLHYLMLVVVFVKSISCLFHGINMYMIQMNGIHVDAWAILWYIVYLTRGALMFVTVLLIGAGWAFIKHVFSDREKKLFLIAIPLQILANVAWVIVKESEEGTSSYTMWNRIFMVVDLLCCFAILFPVIWSIRHLQEASRTDGKAAINLNKLKLFRFFYILLVCYIYFTRIIVYLLKITLPFHYGWMRNVLNEVFLLSYFTLTGYKFRPTSDNPYLQVPVDSDDEIEMEEVLTKTGNMESLSRVNQGRVVDEDEIRTSTMTTVKQRESSHEFD